MNINFLLQLIGPEKIGGWVRAGVAAILVAITAKYPPLGTIIDPSTQTQIAAIVATVVVGAWSHLVKTDTAKVSAAAALPGVAAVVVKTSATDGVAAAAADPTQPKVVSTANVTLPIGVVT